MGPYRFEEFMIHVYPVSSQRLKNKENHEDFEARLEIIKDTISRLEDELKEENDKIKDQRNDLTAQKDMAKKQLRDVEDTVEDANAKIRYYENEIKYNDVKINELLTSWDADDDGDVLVKSKRLKEIEILRRDNAKATGYIDDCRKDIAGYTRTIKDLESRLKVTERELEILEAAGKNLVTQINNLKMTQNQVYADFIALMAKSRSGNSDKDETV